MDEEYLDTQDADFKDAVDTQQDYQEGLNDSLDANFPTQKEQQSLYNLFWKIIKLKDSTKVANLSKSELGDIGLSVRESQKLQMLGEVFGNDLYANYFGNLGEIIASTSMSKDGFLDQLFISQKKFTERARKSSSPLTPQKWKLFNRKKGQEPAQ